MSFVTQTITVTTADRIPSTTLEDVTVTVTSHWYTTLLATHGQTVTVFSPSSLPPSVPTSKYTPTVITATETTTATVTEIDVYLQDAQGSVYSTWFISLSAPESSTTPSGPASPLLYVVEPHYGGWNSWSKGAKAGLIVGVVLTALLFVVMLLCCRKKRNTWFIHTWPKSAQGQATTSPNSGPQTLQPTSLRGGGRSGRYISECYRDWLGKKKEQRPG